MELKNLIERYEALLDRKEALAAETTENNKAIEEARKNLADAMIDAEMDKVVSNGYAYTLSEKMCFTKKGGVDEELFDTLRDDGLGDLIKETVNTRSLQAALKDMTERNGDDLPEQYRDLVTVYTYNDVSRRKSK